MDSKNEKMKQSLPVEKNQKSKISLTTSIAAFVLSLITLILAVVLSFQSHSKESITFKESNCINCAYLLDQLEESQLDGTSESSENYGKVCCGENAKEMTIILKKFMHAQDRKSTDNQIDDINNSSLQIKNQHGPILAHKSFFHSVTVDGICKANSDIIEGKMLLVNFSEAENDTVEVVKQIKIMKDGLQIIFPGIYYVYGSVKFQSMERKTKDVTWHQLIFRERRNTCDRLLKSTHTVCHDCSESKDTALTGGVFYLLKGDVIRVLITEEGLKDYNVENSFLGALMLASN